MSLTRPEEIILTPTAEEVSRAVERILLSSGLRGSEPLRRLLSYLGDRYNGQSHVPVKEHELALAVFGRDEAFDSRLDSIVRVHTGRLRAKIAEYYMGEGEREQLLVEIPKGAYCLVARTRTVTAPVPEMFPRRTRTPFRWRAFGLAGGGLTGVALLAIALFASIPGRANQDSLRRLWKDMTREPDGPILVFSNPSFTGSSITGLHLLEPGAPGNTAVNDTYSGTGEVIAVHELTKLFASLHGSFRVKRAGLLTWDEAKGHDVIFLGAPVQNLPLGEVRLKQFRFELREGRTVILNTNPRGRELPEYAPPQERPIRSDYAVIAKIWSPAALKHVIVLAGTTTYGTQAAAEFVCRNDAVRELFARVPPSARGVALEFEALIGVKVAGGVALQSELLAVHAESRQ